MSTVSTQPLNRESKDRHFHFSFCTCTSILYRHCILGFKRIMILDSVQRRYLQELTITFFVVESIVGKVYISPSEGSDDHSDSRLRLEQLYTNKCITCLDSFLFVKTFPITKVHASRSVLTLRPLTLLVRQGYRKSVNESTYIKRVDPKTLLNRLGLRTEYQRLTLNLTSQRLYKPLPPSHLNKTGLLYIPVQGVTYR